MILLDYAQICIANLHTHLKEPKKPFKHVFSPGPPEEPDPIQPDLLRHMILNSVRKIHYDFSKDYGKLIICTDNANYWRKNYFKYYKAHRKKDREDSGIDWTLVFKILNELRDELEETFPYKVMNVGMAEADDIIAVLTKAYKPLERVLIISSDHDFLQLLDQNVTIYRPLLNEIILYHDDTSKKEDIFRSRKFESSVKSKYLYYNKEQISRFIKEHIIQGDKGDGIPNFLSNDDVLVTEGVKQASVFKLKLEVWLTQEPEEFCNNDERLIRNYARNKKLVDLTQIPFNIEASILEEFEKEIKGSRDKIYSYLMAHRMTNLLSSLSEF